MGVQWTGVQRMGVQWTGVELTWVKSRAYEASPLISNQQCYMVGCPPPLCVVSFLVQSQWSLNQSNILYSGPGSVRQALHHLSVCAIPIPSRVCTSFLGVCAKSFLGVCAIPFLVCVCKTFLGVCAKSFLVMCAKSFLGVCAIPSSVLVICMCLRDDRCVYGHCSSSSAIFLICTRVVTDCHPWVSGWWIGSHCGHSFINGTSPAFYESSLIQCFKCSDAIEIRSEITFNCYTELSHTYCVEYLSLNIHVHTV